MPYKSKAQMRFFHSKGATKAGIKPSMVEEYDEASRGKEMPERMEKKMKVRGKVKVKKRMGT